MNHRPASVLQIIGAKIRATVDPEIAGRGTSGLEIDKDRDANSVARQCPDRADHRMALAAQGVDRTVIAIGRLVAAMMINVAARTEKRTDLGRWINHCHRSR